MTTDLQTTTPAAPVERFSAFSSPAAFEQAQRMAKLLTSSSIVPQNYRDNLSDAVIALEMASRIGASPLAVMQNLYIVHGKPAWSSQFLISCLNSCGKFSTLRYRMTGEKDADSWGCIAWAIDRSGERLEGPEITLGKAKSEGWVAKNGSKWKTFPELMLTYRAATFFVRVYAPELTMGMHTDQEIVDIAPIVTDPVARAKPVKADAPAPQFSVPTKHAEAEFPPTPAKAQTPAERDLKTLRGLIKKDGVNELDVLNHLRTTGAADDSLGSLDDIAELTPSAIKSAADGWAKVSAAIKAAKQPTA